MKSRFLIALAALAATLSTASAATIAAKMDFGGTATGSSGDTYNQITLTGNLNAAAGTNINTWRTIANATALNSVPLVDTTNTSTGWTLDGTVKTAAAGAGETEFGIAGAGGNYTGTVAPLANTAFVTGNSATLPTVDGLFVQDQSAVTISISGLDDTLTYNLLGFIGRDSTANANSLATLSLVTGTGASAYFQNAAGTVTNTEISGLNPNGTNAGLAFGWDNVTSVGGVISFDLASGSSATGNIVDLKALSITQIPEPSAALLGGLGLLGLLRRRRA